MITMLMLLLCADIILHCREIEKHNKICLSVFERAHVFEFGTMSHAQGNIYSIYHFNDNVL